MYKRWQFRKKIVQTSRPWGANFWAKFQILIVLGAAFPHVCPDKRDWHGERTASPVPNMTFIGAMFRPCGAKTPFLDQWVNAILGDNPAARRSPKCIKKKIRSVNADIISFPKFCEKYFLTLTFTEIGNRLIFNMAAVRHLEFKKNHIWSCDCHRVPNMLLRTKYHQNREIFRRDNEF